MSTATATPARSRKRNLDVEKLTAKQALAEKVANVFRLNRQMNEAKNSHDKLRKELFAEMKQLGLDHLDAAFGDIPLTADIITPTGQDVDPTKLAALVPMESFLKMVSVTQKAVTDHAGTAILNQVLVPTTGTENVKVAVKKL